MPPGQFTDSVQVRDGNSLVIYLDAQKAYLTAGGHGKTGTLVLENDKGQQRVYLGGSGAILTLGGNGADGDIVLLPAGVETAAQNTIHLDADSGHGAGAIVVKNSDRKEVVRIDSRLASPPGGFIPKAGGRIVVKDPNGNDTITLDGPSGDIVLKNADCAEEFDLAPSAGVEPGTVVVLDEEGRLQASRRPYDRKVAGVVSGAGDYRPGLVLDRQESRPDRLPVALMGKVYCKADAAYAAIEVGDLLTTSATPGHAMRADDPARAFGAVIGKALRSLRAGQGLIPVLVALR